MRELRRGRVDEKIQGVDEHDNSVKMVTFAQANKGLSMEDFIKKAGNISWIKSLGDTDAQCLIALGCVVLAKLNDTSRLNVWDTIFGVGKEDGLLTDKEAHRIILNTYYDKKSPKSALEGVVSGLYHFWHNTPMYPAIKDTYSRTQSKDAAYVAGVCGAGSELDDEGNLHSSSGDVLDFDTISKDGSLKRKKKSESFKSGIFPENDSYSKTDFDSDFRWLHRAFISNIGTLEDRLSIETKEDIEFLIEYMERMLKKIDSFDIAGKEHLRQDLYSQIEELNKLYKEYSIGESRKGQLR